MILSWVYRILGRIQAFFLKSRLDRQLEEELATHIDLATEEYIRAGMNPDAARRQALLKIGSRDAALELHRDTRGIPIFDCLLQDLRYAARMFRNNPLFVVTAVLSLAIGIGANTAIFTVVNTVLLHPLPYPDSHRIVNITRQGGGTNSIPMFTYWEQHNPGFEDLTAYQIGASLSRAGINMTGGDQPELVQAIRASRNYFRLFGANPVLGRTFSADEDRPGGPPVLVISYGLWQRSFGGDPSIAGKTVSLGGTAYTCVGVISPAFKSYPPADLWTPLQADPTDMNQAHTLIVAGRVPAGMTFAEANARLSAMAKQFGQAHPQQLGGDDKIELRVMQELMTGDVRPALLILLGAVALVLLIACANAANLLLARATTRQREIAIRAAIGGGRARIIQQLLTESMLLSIIAGFAGLLLGSYGLQILLALTPAGLPRMQEVASTPALDPWVAGFTLVLAVVTGMLFGLLPAMQLSRTELAASLKESSGKTATGLKHNRMRSVLVGTEVALAVVLLCGAVLLIRSFVALRNVNLGIDAHNLLTMEVSLAGRAYSKSSAVDRFAREFLDRAERIPGVESAAMASGLPLEGGMDMIFDIPGRPRIEGRKFAGDVQFRVVSERYFNVLRIPLINGRLFQEHEPARTVIINQTMADQFWPNMDPVGQTIVIGPGLSGFFDGGSAEIIGVVGNVRELLDDRAPPTMYQIPLQLSDNFMALFNGLQAGAVIVRTRNGVAPLTVEQPIRRALLASELPAGRARTMEEVSVGSTARRNFNLTLLALFAAIALLLAAVGIYGVMSYSVDQRTLEIGIRAAMGADRRDLLTLVLVEAFRMTVAGVAVGLAASFGLTQLLRAQLFGVAPSDPLTFVVASLILIAVALAAGCIPALRASNVEPVVALRRL